MILINVKKLFGYKGFALYPFVFFVGDLLNSTKTVIKDLRHEFIHCVQQRELWIIGMGAVYLYYYLFGLILGLGHNGSYRNIPFEKEAYANAGVDGYLKTRKKFAWKQYIDERYDILTQIKSLWQKVRNFVSKI